MSDLESTIAAVLEDATGLCLDEPADRAALLRRLVNVLRAKDAR